MADDEVIEEGHIERRKARAMFYTEARFCAKRGMQWYEWVESAEYATDAKYLAPGDLDRIAAYVWRLPP